MSRLPRVARALPDRVRVDAALEALAVTDRLVLSLSLLEGLTVLEIAGALKLKTREVEQRRRVALTTIARELGTAPPARNRRRSTA